MYYAIGMHIKNFYIYLCVCVCSFFFLNLCTLSAGRDSVYLCIRWLRAYSLWFIYLCHICLLFYRLCKCVFANFFFVLHTRFFSFSCSCFVNGIHPIIVNAPLIIFMHLSTLLNVYMHISFNATQFPWDGWNKKKVQVALSPFAHTVSFYFGCIV